jgi:hypothetical protein
LILIVIEALITRTGWKLPEFVRVKSDKVKQPKPQKIRTPKVVKPVEEKVVVEVTKLVVEEDSDRRSRFQRAKDKK